MTLVRWQPRSALRPWTPFHEIQNFQQEMDRLFGLDFGRGGESFLDGAWNPAVDVVQEDDRYQVRVDLPGMKRDEIDVTIHGNTLTISGEKKREAETKEENLYRSERYYGKFSRSLTLPSAVDAEKIAATYKDGVLEISIPKSEEARAKVIKIQS
jgi:HSP20 family protein